MIRKKLALLMGGLALLCACQKEKTPEPNLADDSIEEDPFSSTIAPIQSDSCLLGEKIMGYDTLYDDPDNPTLIPIWRKDNFNVHPQLHRDDIPNLYSNYKIQFYRDRYVIIQTAKLYSEARTFCRIIQFDEKGFQENDTTFYNKTLGSIEVYNGDLILVLDDPYLSTPAYSLDVIEGHAPTIVFLDAHLNELKSIREQRHDMRTYFRGYQSSSKGIEISFEVEKICGECYDYWWTYTIYLDPQFDFVDVEISNKQDSLDQISFYKRKKEIWEN